MMQPFHSKLNYLCLIVRQNSITFLSTNHDIENTFEIQNENIKFTISQMLEDVAAYLLKMSKQM